MSKQIPSPHRPGQHPSRTGSPRRLGTPLYLSLRDTDLVVFLPAEDRLTLLKTVDPWSYVQTSSGLKGYVRTADIDWGQGECP